MYKSFFGSMSRPIRTSRRTALSKRVLAMEQLESRCLLAALPIPTSVALSVSAASLTYGQSETLTATVTANSTGGGTPTGGTVTFKSGSTTIGTSALTSGVATLVIAAPSPLSAGSYGVTAAYNGTSSFAASTAGIGPSSLIATSAGGGSAPSGAQATATSLNNPCSVAADGKGHIFVVEPLNDCVREVTLATGAITTVAGNGTFGFSGDGGPATAAELNDPVGVAVDSSGDIFIADLHNERIRAVLSSGEIITVAGIGVAGFSGDRGQATAAQLYNPAAIAVDTAGDLFIADQGNQRVREVVFTSGALLKGVITTVAGNGTSGFSGDGHAATAAQLANPTGVAVDTSGDIFIADTNNRRIREFKAGGTISTIAGSGLASYNGDNGKATAAGLITPTAVAVDTSGNLFIVDQGNQRVREVNLATDKITTAAGTGLLGYNGDGISATTATLNGPAGAAVDNFGNLFIADEYNRRVREVSYSLATGATGTISTVAGNGSIAYAGDNGPATAAQLAYPEGVAVGANGFAGAVSANGFLFVADYGNDRIRQVNIATGVITTIVGNGTAGYSGDGKQATAAEINDPMGIALDAAGDLFFADQGNNCIREVKIDTGVITTVAGNGIQGFSGDKGQATAAKLSNPTGIAVDPINNLLFIADQGNQRVREVNLATHVITTVAGNGTSGFSGDGHQATAAQLANPTGVAVDTAGHLFIADGSNQRIREVTLATGVITTIAGTGASGFSGDNGKAVAAQLSLTNSGVPVQQYLTGMAVDAVGNLYVADANNQRVREINSVTGVISTLVGTGVGNYFGDGGPAKAASLSSPAGLALDASGNLFIADRNNNRVRIVTPAAPVTVARAVPTVTVTAPVGTSPATATIAGVVNGVDTTPAASLEGVGLTLTYYAGRVVSGTGSPTAPTSPGVYTVVASFAGSADYSPKSAVTYFVIASSTSSAAPDVAFGPSLTADAFDPFRVNDAALLDLLG
jgi:sugar lactone lactonase YvrE